MNLSIAATPPAPVVTLCSFAVWARTALAASTAMAIAVVTRADRELRIDAASWL
jgi:hypothetical protein